MTIEIKNANNKAEKCCESVFKGWHNYPCLRNATKEHEGKKYCFQHYPPGVKERYEIKRQKWAEEDRIYEHKKKIIEKQQEILSYVKNPNVHFSFPPMLKRLADELIALEQNISTAS